jgi:threonine aldolase
MADKMRSAMAEKGYEFFIPTVTNQIFVVLDEERYRKLEDKVSFSFWERLSDGRAVVRLASSWATTESDVDALIALL